MVHSQQYPEVDLVKRLNDFFGFDHNVFLLDFETDHHLYIPTSHSNRAGNFTAQTVYTFGNNLDSNGMEDWVTSKFTLNKIRGKKPLVIVMAMVKFFNFKNDEIQLLGRLKASKWLNIRMKIVVFFVGNNHASMNFVEKLFR